MAKGLADGEDGTAHLGCSLKCRLLTGSERGLTASLKPHQTETQLCVFSHFSLLKVQCATLRFWSQTAAVF